jgi:hypothetical protein
VNKRSTFDSWANIQTIAIRSAKYSVKEKAYGRFANGIRKKGVQGEADVIAKGSTIRRSKEAGAASLGEGGGAGPVALAPGTTVVCGQPLPSSGCGIDSGKCFLRRIEVSLAWMAFLFGRWAMFCRQGL